MPFLPTAEANQMTHESTTLEKVRQSFAVQAQKEGLSNMEFVFGICEALPFADGAFDAVFSRLAFHHFAEPDTPFAEMVRVLRPGRALSLSDMEAAPEPLREREDRLETLRDPSHVRSRSADELCALYEKHGIRLLKKETFTSPFLWMRGWIWPPPPHWSAPGSAGSWKLDGRAEKPPAFLPYI